MVSKSKSKDDQVNLTVLDGPTSLIYADRVLNVSIGPINSKLMLGLEVGPNNTFSPSTTLVMPTIALIDALASMQKTMHENSELKAVMLKGLDAVNEQYNKL